MLEIGTKAPEFSLPDHLIRNMSLFGQKFLERNEPLEIMAL